MSEIQCIDVDEVQTVIAHHQTIIDLDVEALVDIGVKHRQQREAEATGALTFDEARALFDYSRQRPNKMCIQYMKERFGKTVSASNVSRYIRMSQFEYKTAGRAPLIDDVMGEKLGKALARFRDRGLPVDSSLVVSMSRGILERHHRGSTIATGGAKVVSRAWANQWLKANGFRYRAATTDRTVSAKQIVEDGRQFYLGVKEAVEAHGVIRPRNVYNVDEFFVKFDDSATHTWEKISTVEGVTRFKLRLPTTRSRRQ